MNLLIFAIILSILSLSISLLCNRRFEETLAPTSFIVIFVLYCFGLINQLMLGVYFIYLIVLCAAIFLLYRIMTKNFSFTVITIGYVVFVILLLFLWWSHRTRLLSIWDEFSHWGLVPKNYFNLNSFYPNMQSTIAFPGYPPAIALFQFFALKIGNTFTENILYQSLAILNFSMLLPLLKTKSWKDWKTLLPICITIFVLPIIFFSDFYDSIYIDATLGISFFYVLHSSLSEKKYDWFYYASLFLSIAFLILAKSSGVGLTIIALVILLSFHYFNKKTTRTQILTISIVSIVAILFAKYSWDVFLKLTNTNIAWEGINNLNLPSIINFITGNGLPYQNLTFQYFLNALFTWPINLPILPLSYFAYIVIFLLLSFLLYYFSDSTLRKQIKHVSISLIIGSLLYQLSLLILYLFTYSEYEAVNLASYGRYTASFLLGMYFVLLSYYVIHTKKTLWVFLATATILSAITFNKLLDITLRAPAICGGIQEFRDSYQGIEEAKKVLDPETDKVYFLSVYDYGFDFVIARFLFTPISVAQDIPWSLGTTYDSADVWTQDISVEELETLLQEQKVTFLYIHDYSLDFWAKYHLMFENPFNIKVNQLYQVFYQEDYIIFIEYHYPHTSK